MFRLKYLLLAIMLCAFYSAEAQRTYREHLRSGNNIYSDSVYDKSEIEYRKAIELNPKSADAHFNLGNALMYQNKHKEAVEEYKQALMYETDKNRQSQIYHNMGVSMQMSKDYKNAVSAYKQSLLKNPHDNETRYNLAMLLKQQQEQQDQQQQEDNQDNQQNQQPQQGQEPKITPQAAQQMLQAIQAKEKETQDKVNKQKAEALKSRQKDKNW